ncbi:MAG: LacI family DNA-binding transcriptional regulator [Chloroflexota bacterium]
MATIKDVADLAGVSKSTASYAFNKPHLVKADTLNRILEAAKKLDYQPNVFAQGLAGGKTQMIGLLVPDIRYPFNATIAQSIEQTLRELGYLVVVSSTQGDADESIKLMGQLRRRGVSGFIIIPSFFGVNAKLLQAIRAMRVGNIPVIISGFGLDDSEIDQVANQPQKGTQMLVNHLVELGHTQIAYIGTRFSNKRLRGYIETLSKHQILFRDEYVIETDITPSNIREGIERLLSLKQPPTAVFALNDVVALEFQDYCYTHQIEIPQHISLVSFDYQAFVQRKTPGVTSIVSPLEEVGRLSAELMIDRLENPEKEVMHIELPNGLMVRESTAPPRSAA